MVRARGMSQSSESTDPPPLHAIFLRVRPRSELISNDVAAPVVSRHSRPKCVVLKGGFDQTSARSAGGSHPSSRSRRCLIETTLQYNAFWPRVAGYNRRSDIVRD